MLLLGDCNHWLKEIQDNSIDLLVTDPPYGIEFMGKDWDKALVSTETWKECYRVLKQGKLAFVMCSPRQDVLARMIINLQDAGFRTNYSSIYWTYASGFPKAANVSKLIDKKNGATREILGYEERPSQNIRSGNFHVIDKPIEWEHLPITKPATEEAKKMEGAYVGFQPKPAVEVILVVSKGRTISWLDDCRIPYQSEDDKLSATPQGICTSKEQGDASEPDAGRNLERIEFERSELKGRFPANILVSDDVLNDGKITGMKGGVYKRSENKSKGWGFNEGHDLIAYGDSGSYSRYFSLDAWAEKTLPNIKDKLDANNNKKTEIRTRIRNHFGSSEMGSVSAVDHYPDTRFPATTANVFPFLIVPKASKSERNKGVETIEPVKVNDGRNTPIDNPFQRGETLRTNSHPTVKPLKLMSYLITMGSREGDLVLDPFCGSGTVCIAADQLHRKWIGIERNPEYVEIIKKRLMVPLSQLKLTLY